MDDVKINGLVARVILGLGIGMIGIGPLGLMMIGPIGDDPDNWGFIGSIIGIAFYVYRHFREKKNRSQQRNAGAK